MKIVDRGSGTPIVVIPGVQGRWEWMQPAITALAGRCRVITFSLADEPTCSGTFSEQRGFWSYVDQVRDAMDMAGVARAGICGVSYGGLIAAAFAARHPERTSSLILVSALPPSWKPDRRVRFYLRAPRLLTPLFIVGSLRMYREIAAASPGRELRAALQHGWRVLTHCFSPYRMARRVRMVDAVDLLAEVRFVNVPTLVVTGEPALDRVVPVEASLQYAHMWPNTRVETLSRSGHLGLLTRPVAFAELVVPFAEGAAAGVTRRRIG